MRLQIGCAHPHWSGLRSLMIACGKGTHDDGFPTAVILENYKVSDVLKVK